MTKKTFWARNNFSESPTVKKLYSHKNLYKQYAPYHTSKGLHPLCRQFPNAGSLVDKFLLTLQKYQEILIKTVVKFKIENFTLYLCAMRCITLCITVLCC